MHKDDAKVLFEYLGDILYEKNVGGIDINQLSKETRDLGEGLRVLADYVKELKDYSANVSKGNLDVEFPQNENPLCLGLKNLHSNLNHLTWQAKQVAGGDYSQHVSYLGEFSDAFNMMIEQLKDRELQMKRELEEKERHAVMLQNYNDMFISLTRKCKEWIIVNQRETNEVLYCNKQQRADGKHVCVNCPYRIAKRDVILDCNSDDDKKDWEFFDDEDNKWYLINRFLIEWEQEPACAYIIEDITRERLEEKRLTELAYRDPLTNLFNRRYLISKVKKLIRERTPFSFCYVDIDGLKYVNDHFGHSEGDRYICYLTGRISRGVRGNDIFARIGGDEFVVVFLGAKKPEAESRMESIYQDTRRKIVDGGYPDGGFSYGVSEYQGDKETDFDEILQESDDRMYRCKLTHKC